RKRNAPAVTAGRAATLAAAAAADAGIVTNLRRERLWPGRRSVASVARCHLVRRQYPFPRVRCGCFITNFEVGEHTRLGCGWTRLASSLLRA
ncbi:MAG: hypothetical protein ABSA45_06365, partial [Verrucomicrobiota bacterium]